MLLGEKVALRPIFRDDLPRFLSFFNDIEVELAGGGDPPTPKTLKEVEKFFDVDADKPDPSKTNFAIEADGKLVGFCGLFEIDETSRTCELGIFIGDKEFWGHGYGRDAVRLLLDYAFRLRNFRRMWLEVHSENERGIRAYKSCGFIEEGRLREHTWLDGRYVDMVLMGVLRDEWRRS
ncbi:MAG: GNAT family N-acetyltransferase [Rubrobacteraceae bacterium]|jgi:RimJ/RimL family protein N-acetyltransferase|nr:GNAT family N-acetyltransferase [Rubrobacter sp.]